MKILGMGVPELLIILVVVLLIFGPKNLPKLGASLGKTVKNLRKGMSDEDEEASSKKTATVEEEVEVVDEDDADVVEDEAAKKPAAKKRSAAAKKAVADDDESAGRITSIKQRGARLLPKACAAWRLLRGSNSARHV